MNDGRLKNQAVARHFNRHVKEQLPWYQLAPRSGTPDSPVAGHWLLRGYALAAFALI